MTKTHFKLNFSPLLPPGHELAYKPKTDKRNSEKLHVPPMPNSELTCRPKSVMRMITIEELQRYLLREVGPHPLQ